jgi:hypothetical protein
MIIRSDDTNLHSLVVIRNDQQLGRVTEVDTLRKRCQTKTPGAVGTPMGRHVDGYALEIESYDHLVLAVESPEQLLKVLKAEGIEVVFTEFPFKISELIK